MRCAFCLNACSIICAVVVCPPALSLPPPCVVSAVSAAAASPRTQISELEGEKKKFQSLVSDHKGLYETIEKRIAEQKLAEEKKMQEEKDFLKFQAQHLESFLKSAAQ